MNKPNNIDPHDWARYNEQQARTLANLMGIEPPELELAPYEIEVRVVPPEYAHPARELMRSVAAAASDLHGQGERSDRIALQLITALSRFAQGTGL